MIPTIKHTGKVKTMEEIKKSVVAKGGGVVKIKREVQENLGIGGFKCSENILYVIMLLSKSIGCIIPSVNSHVNYGFKFIMMFPCRFTTCNKCTILARDTNNGEAMHVLEYMGNLCIFCSILCELKTTLKRSLLQKMTNAYNS